MRALFNNRPAKTAASAVIGALLASALPAAPVTADPTPPATSLAVAAAQPAAPTATHSAPQSATQGAAHTLAPDSREQRERMAALAMLVGTWRGTGWVMLPDGSREAFVQDEWVSLEQQGEVLVIRGRGTARFDDGSERVIHDALALVTWDSRRQVYRWQARRAGADWIDTTAVLTAPDTLVWTFEVPGSGSGGPQPRPPMVVRYAIQITADRWVEVGTAGREDQGPGREVLGMDLQRTSPDPTPPRYLLGPKD